MPHIDILIKIACITLLGLLLTSCGSVFSRKQPQPNGIVLNQGDSLVITIPGESIRISWIDSFTRKIQRNDLSLNVKMISRNGPFYGIEGIYNPGDTSDLGHEYNGYRIIYQESIINFTSTEQFVRSIIQGSSVESRYYAKDGLMISLANNNDNWKFSIDIFQIKINGVPVDFSQVTSDSFRVIYQGSLTDFTNLVPKDIGAISIER